MKRRELLSALGSAGFAAGAGCLADDDPTDGDGNGGGDDPTRSPTASTPTPTVSLTPPDVTTPAPGECEAATPPEPSTGAGLPDPRSYPGRPDAVDVASVGPFLEQYETAYRYNRQLAEIAEDGECLKYLEMSVTDRSVAGVANGVVGEVTTRGSFTGSPCPDATGTDTATALPHADLAFETAHYYATDRFLVREGIIVECWER